MSPKLEKLSTKNSTELIVYQISEVKNLMENMNVKFDGYADKTDARLIALEKFQAAQMVQDAKQPQYDIQKIVLTAFGIISTLVAIVATYSNVGK